MRDDDPYQPSDPGDEYERHPDADEYAIPDHDTQPVDPSPSPPPVRHSTAPEFVSVPCTRCGYNLTGVAIGGTCPECGARVDHSLYASASAPVNGMAVTSMIIGIVSVSGLCCCPTGYLGVLGLVFGIVAMNQMSDGRYSNASKGMATAGLICSGIALGLAVVWTMLAIVG